MLYRCTKSDCRQRASLKHHHAWYVKPPKCKACGKLLEKPDYWQMERNKINTCHCDAFHYPHRKGSSVYCQGYKGVLTSEQIDEFEMYRRGYGY